MFDATGKLPSGVKFGNVYSLGSFEECLNISGRPGYPAPVYCDITLFQVLNWGVCLPISCVEALVFHIANTTGIQDVSTTCANPSIKFTSGAIAAIGVCVLFSFLVVLATYVDQALPVGTRVLALFNTPQSTEFEDMVEEDIEMLDIQQKPHKHEKSSFERKLLNCFSLSHNIPKIFNFKSSADAVQALDGMRVLSLLWVIWGHSYFWSIGYSNDNGEVVSSWVTYPVFQFIVNGTLSVDSFFFISGFLVAYGVFKTLHKNPRFPWIKYYVHRYIRLTPMYGFVFLFYSELLAYMGSGPQWVPSTVSPSCPNWWANLLYVQNFVQSGDGCMEWAWYLANDMQFYVLAPLLVIPLYFKPRIGFILTILSIIAATGVSFGIAYHYDLKANMFAGGFNTPAPANEESYNDIVYVKPWFRVNPFIVGILAAFYIKHSNEWKMSRQTVIVVFAGWVLSLLVLYFVLFALTGEFHDTGFAHELTRVGNAMYIATGRLGWGVGLAWVTVACIKGYGGLAAQILESPMWIPLSRINYCAYLVHPMILIAFFSANQDPFHITGWTVTFIFAAVVLLSYLFAAILVLFVEAPIANLEKLLLK